MITLASGFPPFSKMWEVLGGVFDDSSIVALAQCHVLKNISYSEERPLTSSLLQLSAGAVSSQVLFWVI